MFKNQTTKASSASADNVSCPLCKGIFDAFDAVKDKDTSTIWCPYCNNSFNI